MAKVLNVNDMLDAAAGLARDSIIDAAKVAEHQATIEKAASDFAQFLAESVGVTLSQPATYEEGFGGLCATFTPGPNGETCDHIGNGDPGGDWDF